MEAAQLTARAAQAAHFGDVGDATRAVVDAATRVHSAIKEHEQTLRTMKSRTCSILWHFGSIIIYAHLSGLYALFILVRILSNRLSCLDI